MTKETDQYLDLVPVELDLVATSKAADKKWKYNARASARFRSRQRAREKEMLPIITKLSHDIKELRAQQDFYQEERNIIREHVVGHISATAHQL